MKFIIRNFCLKSFTMWNFQSFSRSQWPRGLNCRYAAARLLGLWVRIPPGAWISVSRDCCVLSGRGLCVRLITRPDESYRVWCVLSVSVKPRRWGGSDPLWAVAPWGRGYFFLRGTVHCGRNTSLALFRCLRRRRISSEIISIHKVFFYDIAQKLFPEGYQCNDSVFLFNIYFCKISFMFIY
jgi:hypothetical protein